MEPSLSSVLGKPPALPLVPHHATAVQHPDVVLARHPTLDKAGANGLPLLELDAQETRYCVIWHRLAVQHEPSPIVRLVHEKENLDPYAAVIEIERLHAHVLPPIPDVELDRG